MVCFTEFVRKQGLVPGGFLWVTTEGNNEKCCRRLLSFVESIGQSVRQVGKQDRQSLLVETACVIAEFIFSKRTM